MEQQSAENAGTPASTATGRAPAAGVDRRRTVWDLVWPIAIILVAFGLRLAYVLQLQSSPYFATHVMDPLYHHEWAEAFAEGKTFWDGPYFRAPLYPWFLGTMYWLFGADNPLAARIVQAVLGSLSCGLLYLIGRRAFGRTVGVVAGLSAATYWIFLYYDAELLIPVLIVFLDLVLLWLLLRAADRLSPTLWGLCGLVLGLSAIARPNILLFAPALVVWAFVLHRPRWRRALGYSSCLFAGCVLPILPITIRNYAVGKDLVLIASQAGVNFYIGNNRHSDGMSAVIKGDPAEWWPCYNAQLARAEKAEGRRLRASEVSRWYFRQALRFMYLEPGMAGRLLLNKLAYFWSAWEVSNNQDIYFMTGHYTPFVRYLPLGFWIVGPLGALGVLLSLRRAKELFPLWGFVLIYMFSVVLFFVTARYRVPIAAVLILLGSYAACWCWQALRAPRWRALGLATVVLAAMGVLAARTPSKVDKQMLQEHRETGRFLVTGGQFSEGEHLLSELVRRAEKLGLPVDAESWFYLGFARLKLDDPAGAVECFERALERRPYYPEARSNLGYALAALGRPDEAVQHLEQVIHHDPENEAARVSLASGLAWLGRIDEAIPHLLRAIELDPENTRALLRVASTIRGQGNTRGAERLLRAAVERFPDDLSLTAALIELLALQPDTGARAEAVRLGEQACRRAPRPDARLLHVTALAYFSSGRRDKAIELERRAVETAVQDGRTTLAEQCRRTLQGYQTAARRPLIPLDAPSSAPGQEP